MVFTPADRSRRLRLGFVALALAPVAILCCSGSGGTSSQPMSASDGSVQRNRLDATLRLDAPCLVTLDTPDLLPAQHVADGTPVQYNSNPPSSGPHYAVWAAFQEYDKPIDRRYLVHSMEHGAVVIFYKCPEAGSCQEFLDAARAAAASRPDDPSCAGQGARNRIIIVPDPLLDVPLAAAAWGWVYRAACTDRPTLQQFVADHYGQGPENLCAPGQSTF